jgi:hypothetical protein
LATSGGNQTLAGVDEKLMQAGVFLEDIAKNPQKVDCLDTFARCKDIVKWLQKETKGESYSATSTVVHVSRSSLLFNIHLLYTMQM